MAPPLRTIRRARNRRQDACSGRRRIGVVADQNMLETPRWNAARIDGDVDAIIDFTAGFTEEPTLQLAHYLSRDRATDDCAQPIWARGPDGFVSSRNGCCGNLCCAARLEPSHLADCGERHGLCRHSSEESSPQSLTWRMAGCRTGAPPECRASSTGLARSISGSIIARRRITHFDASRQPSWK
jgi:hypothetical protein